MKKTLKKHKINISYEHLLPNDILLQESPSPLILNIYKEHQQGSFQKEELGKIPKYYEYQNQKTSEQTPTNCQKNVQKIQIAPEKTQFQKQCVGQQMRKSITCTNIFDQNNKDPQLIQKQDIRKKNCSIDQMTENSPQFPLFRNKTNSSKQEKNKEQQYLIEDSVITDEKESWPIQLLEDSNLFDMWQNSQHQVNDSNMSDLYISINSKRDKQISFNLNQFLKQDLPSKNQTQQQQQNKKEGQRNQNQQKKTSLIDNNNKNNNNQIKKTKSTQFSSHNLPTKKQEIKQEKMLSSNQIKKPQIIQPNQEKVSFKRHSSNKKVRPQQQSKMRKSSTDLSPTPKTKNPTLSFKPQSHSKKEHTEKHEKIDLMTLSRQPSKKGISNHNSNNNTINPNNNKHKKHQSQDFNNNTPTNIVQQERLDLKKPKQFNTPLKNRKQQSQQQQQQQHLICKNYNHNNKPKHKTAACSPIKNIILEKNKKSFFQYSAQHSPIRQNKKSSGYQEIQTSHFSMEISNPVTITPSINNNNNNNNIVSKQRAQPQNNFVDGTGTAQNMYHQQPQLQSQQQVQVQMEKSNPVKGISGNQMYQQMYQYSKTPQYSQQSQGTIKHLFSMQKTSSNTSKTPIENSSQNNSKISTAASTVIQSNSSKKQKKGDIKKYIEDQTSQQKNLENILSHQKDLQPQQSNIQNKNQNQNQVQIQKFM